MDPGVQQSDTRQLTCTCQSPIYDLDRLHPTHSSTLSAMHAPRASQEPTTGEVKLRDGLLKDGLWDVYNDIQGSITAASSSPLSDGASALVLCDKTSAKKYDREKKG